MPKREIYIVDIPSNCKYRGRTCASCGNDPYNCMHTNRPSQYFQCTNPDVFPVNCPLEDTTTSK